MNKKLLILNLIFSIHTGWSDSVIIKKTYVDYTSEEPRGLRVPESSKKLNNSLLEKELACRMQSNLNQGDECMILYVEMDDFKNDYAILRDIVRWSYITSTYNLKSSVRLEGKMGKEYIREIIPYNKNIGEFPWLVTLVDWDIITLKKTKNGPILEYTLENFFKYIQSTPDLKQPINVKFLLNLSLFKKNNKGLFAKFIYTLNSFIKKNSRINGHKFYCQIEIVNIPETILKSKTLK